MGFLDKITPNFLRKSSQIQEIRDVIRSRYGLDPGEDITPENAVKCATVYICAKIISEDCAKLPIHVYKKDKNGARSLVTDDNIGNLLKYEPNLNNTAIEFWEMMFWDLVVRGNAIARISRSSTGEVLEVIPQNIANVETKVNKDTGIVEYYIKEKEVKKKIPRDEIFHIRDLPDFKGWGRTRIDYAAVAYGIEHSGERLTSRLIKNGLRMTPVLSHPKTLSQSARDALKKELVSSTTGDGAFEPLLLQEGLDWKPSQMTSRDAQFLEHRQFSRSTILSLYRMPPHKVGDHSKTSYNSLELEDRNYLNSCLMSFIIRAEQAIRRDLFTKKQKEQNYYAKLNVNAIARADMKSRYESYVMGRRAGILNADECRENEELPPRSDGRGSVYMESGDLYPSGENRNEI